MVLHIRSYIFSLFLRVYYWHVKNGSTFTGLARDLLWCPLYRTKPLFYYKKMYIKWFIIFIWSIKYRVPNTKRRYGSTGKLLIVNFSNNSNFKNIWWKSQSVDPALLFYVFNNCMSVRKQYPCNCITICNLKNIYVSCYNWKSARKKCPIRYFWEMNWKKLWSCGIKIGSKTRRCPEKFCLDDEKPWRHKKRIHQLLDNINQNRTNGISHQNQMFKSMIWTISFYITPYL